MTAKSIPPTGSQPPDLSSRCLSIAEHAPLPMAMVEGAGHTVRYANPAFCRLIDQTKEQLVGKSFCEMLPKKDECVTLLDRVFRTGKPASYTEQESSKPHLVFRSYTMWPVMADERPVGVVIQVTETAQFHEQTVAMNEALMLGSVRQHELTEAADSANALLQVEIRERKQAEKELRLAQAQLKDRAGQLEALVAERTSELTVTNEQLEAFIYSIAHDLRAPLRAMQGFSALLVREADTALNETGKDYAHRINKSAQFMDALLIDLLTFSRISQERVELTPVNMESVVESVLSRLQQDIQEKGARVESSGPWPSVLANETTLTQVLYNLVSNALKFVSTGVHPLVRLRAEEQAEFIRVWVEDNGPGIPAEALETIFESGYTTRANGAAANGAWQPAHRGLGLSITRSIVEAAGGRIHATNRSPSGARFEIELPLRAL